MNLHFFEDYLKQKLDNHEIDTVYPDEKGNVPLCCPFYHTREEFDEDSWETKTINYLEDVQSSSINLDMRVFHCFTCNRSFKELEFAKEITGKTNEELIKEYTVKEELKSISDDWKNLQHRYLLENNDMIDKLHQLKISDAVISELQLGCMTNFLATPVFKNGQLINIARYNINRIPDYAKVLYNKNANSGDIIPFDIWKNDNRNTIVCEGEKDMLIARSHGFNAITLTGGSQSSLQKEYLDYFKNRNVYICYDNDDAGKRGSKVLYKELKELAKEVHIIDISSVCSENKEDVAEFFIKYNKSHDDFVELLNNNKISISDDDLKEVKAKYKLDVSKLESNIKNSKFNKSLLSSLQIIATCTETYAVNEFARFMPINEEDKDLQRESRTWFLESSKETFLELIENKVTRMTIAPTLAKIVGLDPKKWENFYKLELGPLKTIYKVTVSDLALENDDRASEFIIDLYSRVPLDIGKTYDIEYKLYPHPNNGRKIIAVAHSVKEKEITFNANDMNMINSLNKFRCNGDMSVKIDELYQSARCYIAPYLNKQLWLLMDLVFNSPLDITYKKVMRGALDIFVLGDTRTGKSETSRALREMYDFGEVVPLKTATVASLIGGTDEKIKKTKLGVLPRYHKELVILEEFSGSPPDFIKTLTEIRSSGTVKIYRVAGDIKAPCKLRMITISNPISESGNLMTLSSFPNAIEPINELIKSPEDIARYDAFMVFPQVDDLTNPFKSELKEQYKLDKKDYENKMKWIKSLNEDNVVISDELGSYIFNKALYLNKIFECSFTLFGSETDKKIARFASALAVMLVSTDDYEHIKVTKEHVDYICEMLINLYDNPVFRLKEYAKEENMYKTVNENDTTDLQRFYPNNVTLIDFLGNVSKVSRNELMTVSGLNKDEFSKVFNFLVARKFVKLLKDQVAPTIKFRNTYKLLDKSFNLHDSVL